MIELITHSKPVYSLGTVLAQIIEFDGSKNLSKVSLNLSVTRSDPKSRIIGEDGVLSFQAANFQESRKPWAFQPVPHWSNVNLILDPNFDGPDDDSSWTTPSPWLISGGVATTNGSATSQSLSQTVAPLTIGAFYSVTFTVNRIAGFYRQVCGTANGILHGASGTFTETNIANNTGDFKIGCVGFNGTVDDVRVVSVEWDTSGTTIKNTGQVDNYANAVDAALNAPYIKYNLFLDKQGSYDLWGFGYTSSEGVFWAWNNDTSDLRKFTLGGPYGPPQWTKFGTIYSEEGGECSFSIYLSDAAVVVLDQWYFTQDLAFSPSALAPIETLSESPFNTCVRVRSLNEGTLDSLTSPSVGSQSFTSWMSSKLITASGKYNYSLQTDNENSITYTDGLSLEFWQVGGSSEHFSSWDFVFPDSSIGDSFISTDFGENFTELS